MYEAVRFFLQHGTDVQMKPGEPSLIEEARSYGHYEIVRLLLDAGANVNVPVQYSRSPLDVAESMHRQDIIPILLQAGADRTSRAGYYSEPLMQAVENYDKEAVVILLEYGATVNEIRIC